MRLVPFEFGGQTYHLLLNWKALCDIQQHFSQDDSILDPISVSGVAGYEAVCWYLAKLGEQGELYRRWEGRDPGPFPDIGAFQVGLSPLDAGRAKLALKAAIAAGFGREEEPERKEVDLGLLELEKKTGGG